MKKFALLSYLLFSINFTYAQVILNENFEDAVFPPVSWTSAKIVGNRQWQQVHEQFFSGYGSALIDFDSVAGENWLITPILNNISLADSLHFYIRKKSLSPSLDSLYLKVSTTTQDITSFVNYLGGISVSSLPSGNWIGVKVPLSAFNGQHIYIAFEHKNSNGCGMYLDSVSVMHPVVIDVAASGIEQSGKVYISSLTKPIVMIGNVQNNGLNKASFVVTRTVSPGNYSHTIMVDSLERFTRKQIIFPPFTGYTKGTFYAIKDSVFIAGDGAPENDVAISYFQPLVSKTTLIYYFDDTSKDSMVAHFKNAGLEDIYDIMDWYTVPSFSLWHSLVILCPEANSFSNIIKDSVKAYIDQSSGTHKKTVFIFGNDLGYIYDRNKSPYKDTAFFRQYLKAIYINDNWINDIPSANGTIIGRGEFSSIPTAEVINAGPDYVRPCNGGIAAFVPNYKGATGDTAAAVFYYGEKYNLFLGTNLYSGYLTGGPQIVVLIKNLTFSSPTGLPPELTFFTSEINNNDVILKWNTATQNNTFNFVIQRSRDSIAFKDIEVVNSNVRLNPTDGYQFVDNGVFNDPSVKSLFYRLKLTSNDGIPENYSAFKKVALLRPPTVNIITFPNPFTGDLKINFISKDDAILTAQLMNISGEYVVQQDIHVNQGTNAVSFDNLAGLPEGIYILEIKISGLIQRTRIIKTK